MNNPFLKNIKYLGLYLFFWLAIGFFHAFWLKTEFEIKLEIAIIESLIFNGLYAIFGFFTGSSILFLNSENIPFFKKIFNFLALGIVLTYFWLELSTFLLNKIFSEFSQYLFFLQETSVIHFISGIFYFSIIVFIYYIIDYSQKLNEKQENEIKWQALIQEAEYKALKSQINPHFLFNSLNSISYLTLTEPDKAHKMIIQLSDYLRYSISNWQSTKVKLSEEIENIRRYLEIEKIRFGSRLNYSTEISQNLDNFLIPNMILQPLFENAVKYGVHESLEPIFINTSFWLENEYLMIKITNNYDAESYTTKKGEGVGLENIKKRLKLIYGIDNLLGIEKKQGIFIVNLTIPPTIKQ